MIDLFARRDRSGFGVAAALDAERIPYRRATDATSPAGGVAVVTREDLTPAVVARMRRSATVTLGHGGALTREVFGGGARCAWQGAAEIPLTGSLWPDAVRECAARFEAPTLRLPAVTGWTCATPPRGEVLASARRPDGSEVPAIVRHGVHWWSLLDLGAALADLMDEGYREPMAGPARPMPRVMLAAYYRAPEALRRVVQRRTYRGLQERLARTPVPSRYPVDPAGWLLIETLLGLLRATGEPLVRLHRWPAPHRSAAALTHDLEPSRYSYGPGLASLRERVRRLGHPPTYGVVARSARRMTAGARAALRAADVACHGSEHRGETMLGTREDIAAALSRTRTELQATLDAPIPGFRSPRLDRGAPLLWAVERAGFGHDSSYPDVDRENLQGYGGGVLLNVPFRPPLDDGDGTVRPSRCLELPVSAPDCIQPLFEGGSLHSLRRAVRRKVDFVTATDGLYVGIVHAGVFGARDVRRRGAHLAFVRRLLRRPDVWLANLSQIAGWWRVREQIALDAADGCVRVTNHGARRASGLRCLVEYGPTVTELTVPPLEPGASVTLAMDMERPARAEGA